MWFTQHIYDTLRLNLICLFPKAKKEQNRSLELTGEKEPCIDTQTERGSSKDVWLWFSWVLFELMKLEFYGIASKYDVYNTYTKSLSFTLCVCVCRLHARIHIRMKWKKNCSSQTKAIETKWRFVSFWCEWQARQCYEYNHEYMCTMHAYTQMKKVKKKRSKFTASTLKRYITSLLSIILAKNHAKYMAHTHTSLAKKYQSRVFYSACLSFFDCGVLHFMHSERKRVEPNHHINANEQSKNPAFVCVCVCWWVYGQ